MNDFELEEGTPMKEDKILNNSYNSGEIEYEAFSGMMKIDDRIFSQYEDQLSDNLVEKRVEKRLDEDLYKFFQNSPFYAKYKNPRRVDKGDMSKMYYYFKEVLSECKTYSSMQIFIGFAEFFQINYDQLYAEVGVLDKESLLKELTDKGQITSRIKTKKLF
jgi:hypothetical protein